MIQPDAKCVVNGAKVNEAIMALNPLLAMSVGYIAGGKPPQVTYSDGEVKILLPLADSVAGFSLEELDIVDTNNAASSRYFMTSTGSVSTYGTTTASTSGTPTGKQSTSPTNKDRNGLGGTPNDKNRDKLDTGAGRPIAPGSAGVAPTGNVTGGGGMLKWDGNKVVEGSGNNLGGSANMISVGGDKKGGFGGGVDAFGNDLFADGSRVTPAGMPRFDSGPLPGAPPLGGDKKGAFGGGVDAFGNELFADGSRVTPAGMGRADSGPLPGAPPLSGDSGSGSGNFSPGSRDYRALQLYNPKAFAAIMTAEEDAMMNDLPTLSSYLQQMGADLKKYNPEKYQALIKQQVKLSKEAMEQAAKSMMDDLPTLSSYLKQMGADLKKHNPEKYQALIKQEVKLSKEATQGRQ